MRKQDAWLSVRAPTAMSPSRKGHGLTLRLAQPGKRASASSTERRLAPHARRWSWVASTATGLVGRRGFSFNSMPMLFVLLLLLCFVWARQRPAGEFIVIVFAIDSQCSAEAGRLTSGTCARQWPAWCQPTSCACARQRPAWCLTCTCSPIESCNNILCSAEAGLVQLQHGS